MVTHKTQYKDINNDILISEVKLRPALYDRCMSEYSDAVYKKKLWEEINEKLYADIWHELDETQKDLKRSELHKRWNNLRTCFSRELKVIRDPLQNKRRKYIYFDKLTFLLGDGEPYPGYQPSEDTDIHFDTIASIERLEDQSSYAAEKKNVAQKKALSKMKAEKKKNVEKYVQYSINELKDEVGYNRSEEVVFDGSASCSSQKTIDTDADTNFALSLVPFLKTVPLQKKIDAQIELLSVLKKYTNNIRYSVVKYEKEDSSEQDDESEILTLFEDEK